MRTAVNNFQKSLFVFLLYASTFAGFISDIAEGGRTMLYLAFDGLIVFLSILSLAHLRGRLVWIVLFMFACITVNFSYSSINILYSLNGVREIVMLICIAIFYNKVFSEDNEELTEEYVEIFKRFGVIFLIAQIPVAFMQFYQHGPSDFVGGTFGDKGSGILTLSVVCVVFFMSHFLRNHTQRVFLYFCLVPLLMNETKVSFILIPTLMLFIHFQPKFKNIVGAVAAAALFLFLFNQYYSNKGFEFENNLAGIFSRDFLDDYLFGDIYYSEDVPRFTKIFMGWQLITEETKTMLFGVEYGIFKGGKMVETSQFGQSVQWLLSGTRPYLFFLILQGGLLLIFGVFWLIMHINKFFARNNNKFKMFLLFIFMMILFYNDALRNHGFVVIFFFSMYYANSNLYNRKLSLN